MTPAIKYAKKANVYFSIHEFDHDPESDSYGKEAATKLGVDFDKVFKTLVVDLNNQKLAVGVLPVSTQLDLKRFAKVLGVKKVTLADKRIVEKITGYVLGGVSPIGQKKRLTTTIDLSATKFDSIFVSAGKRGLIIELAPNDLCQLTNGKFGTIGKPI